MTPFLAIITPIDEPVRPGDPKPPRPDHTLPGDLPRPSHPIWYPLPPGAPVDPEYGVPIEHPEHPIAPPTPGQPPRPNQGLPGPQPHPEHPIVLPPDSSAGGGWGPIYIWGGGPGARPPIAIPPEGETPPGKVMWKAAWTPTTGWVTFGIIVPEGPTVTPSKRR